MDLEAIVESQYDWEEILIARKSKTERTLEAGLTPEPERMSCPSIRMLRKEADPG
jgi:DNA-binding transcriptional regulator YiaG